MCGICLGVLSEKKSGKKRLALKSFPGNAAFVSEDTRRTDKATAFTLAQFQMECALA